MAMRRSASEPISQIASAIMSAANATGSAWKLPPDSAIAVLGEDQRIVGDAVGLVAEHAGDVAQHVEHGAHHLRLAAQAVGVLHAVVADEVRGADGAAGHQARAARRRSRSGRGGRRSAWMRASNGASEPLAASVESTPVTSAARNSVGGLKQRGERIGGRELRAVEQRQPFLGPERQRLQAGAAQRLGGGHAPVRRIDLADADHGRRHVRERREIAGCADRALARHDRHQARWRACASSMAIVAGRTPEAPWARLASFSAIISRTTSARRRLADAGRVRQHDVALQLREIAPRSMRTLASLPKPVLMP